MVIKVATRHAASPQQELGQERQVESNEGNDGPKASLGIVVHHAKHFGPPVVNTTKVCEQCGSNHDKVEVGNDEVSVVQVHVCGQTR